ncbi:MAG: response regulator transcription factor [Vulcanimicrobiaceae bacterium]
MVRQVYESIKLSATKILIADDHPLFREALRHVVDCVCSEATYVEVATHGEMLAHTREDERYDLIFVDLTMPGGDDFNELVSLRKRVPSTPTIVVSSRDDLATIRRAMACGIAAYIPKSASAATMDVAIRRVLAGEMFVPHEATGDDRATAAPALTPRQYAVLEALARGRSNRQIAADLGIEEITVKVHISAILRKLHVKNRLQAVVVSRAYFEGGGA